MEVRKGVETGAVVAVVIAAASLAVWCGSLSKAVKVLEGGDHMDKLREGLGQHAESLKAGLGTVKAPAIKTLVYHLAIYTGGTDADPNTGDERSLEPDLVQKEDFTPRLPDGAQIVAAQVMDVGPRAVKHLKFFGACRKDDTTATFFAITEKTGFNDIVKIAVLYTEP